MPPTKSLKTVSRSRLPADLFQLEEVVGQFMEYWGFKKIHGRIWAHLYTCSDPLDSIELMERLGVSKGLMSLALRDLLEYHVIISDHVGKHGSVYYRANPDLVGVITNVLRTRELIMLNEAHKVATALQNLSSQKKEKSRLSDEKIQNILELTNSAQMMLQVFLTQESDPNQADLFSQLLNQTSEHE